MTDAPPRADLAHLARALASRYSSHDVLDTMVLEEFNLHADLITSRSDLRTRIDDLIKWAEHEGRLDDLARLIATPPAQSTEAVRRRLRTRYRQAFSTFTPLGADEPLDLEAIYVDLSVYKQFSSPYYKNRAELFQEFTHARERLLDATLARVDAATRAALGPAYLTRHGLPRHQNTGLIDQLRELTTHSRLGELICHQIAKEMLQELHYETQRTQGPSRDATYEDPTAAYEATRINLRTRVTQMLRQARSDTTETVLDRVRDKISAEIRRYEELKDRVPFDDALRQNRRMVVLGHPGSGKSTLLRHQCLRITADDTAPLPLLFELKRLNSWAQPITAESLAGELLESAGLAREAPTQTYRLLLLLDGLDEVRADRRSDALTAILGLDEFFPETACVVTCRILGYEAGLQGFRALELAELTDLQVASFVHGWFRRLQRERDAAALMKDLKRRTNALRMLRNPFLLTLYCIKASRSPPGGMTGISRAALYSSTTSMLLVNRETASGTRRLTRSLTQLERVLQDVAVHSYERARGYFSAEELLQWCPTWTPEELDACLVEIETVSGLLRHLSDRDVGFAHLSIQEFYAARFHVTKPVNLRELLAASRNWEMLRFLCGLGTADRVLPLLREMIDIVSGTGDWRLAVAVSNCIGDASHVLPEILRDAFDMLMRHLQNEDPAVRLEVETAMATIVTRDRTGILTSRLKKLLEGSLAENAAATAVLLDATRDAADEGSRQRFDLVSATLHRANTEVALSMIRALSDSRSEMSIRVLRGALLSPNGSSALEALASAARNLRVSLVEDTWRPLLRASPGPTKQNAPPLWFRLSEAIEPGLHPGVERTIDYYLTHLQAYALRVRVSLAPNLDIEPDEPFIASVNQQCGLADQPLDTSILRSIAVQARDHSPVVLDSTPIRPFLDALLACHAPPSVGAALHLPRLQWRPPIASFNPDRGHGLVLPEGTALPNVPANEAVAQTLFCIRGYFWPDLLALGELGFPHVGTLRSELIEALTHWLTKSVRELIDWGSLGERIRWEFAHGGPGRVSEQFIRFEPDAARQAAREHVDIALKIARYRYLEYHEATVNERSEHSENRVSIARFLDRCERRDDPWPDRLLACWRIFAADRVALPPDALLWSDLF